MIYNLEKPIDVQRLVAKVKYYIQKKQPIELKRMSVKKSIAQNSYFHLIVSWFAFEYGEDFNYVKQEIIKKIVCPEIFKSEFINEKNGECREHWLSFSTLDKDQTTYVIDKFRDYSSKRAGIYLPEPDDLASIQEIEIQLKNNERYL
jgi:uncharacterized protein (DUF2164 family)